MIKLRTVSGDQFEISEIRLVPKVLIDYAFTLQSEIDGAKTPWFTIGTPLWLISAEIAKALVDKRISKDIHASWARLAEVTDAITHFAMWFSIADINVSGASGLQSATATGPSIDISSLFPIPKVPLWSQNMQNTRRYGQQVAAQESLGDNNIYVVFQASPFIEIKVGTSVMALNTQAIESFVV